MRTIKKISQYEELLNEGKPLLIDFYADWCGPCQSMIPTLDRIDDDFEELVIAKVNVDDNPALTKKFSVKGIPALFFMNGSEIVDKAVGSQPYPKLAERVEVFLKKIKD
ncbi:thioredoxin family protein [Aureibacter tunicatorum]|uniref:Thioredoxin n=1 Tax=Aureibacter tunicatorum TaxID=866807 RepID=A0AAE3XQ60_9BACT|nr:thioredoxin family protein [Aureibacter tunicatorum]MDR6240678.1 thioredoxin [Aureibacter tunicatorum]BDD06989.1 thioredoxin [Aureibacter tunicatorum]